MEEKKELLQTDTKRLIVFWAVLFGVVFVIYQVYATLIVPFILALLFAFLLAPLVDFLDRYRIPRALIVLVTLSVAMLLISYLSIKIFPFLFKQLMQIVNAAPQVSVTINETWLPKLSDFLSKFGFEKDFVKGLIVSDDLSRWSGRIQSALNALWYSVPQVVGTVVNIVMTPLLTFFFVKDEKKLISLMGSLVPRDLRKTVFSFVRDIAITLNSVIKGQITVAFILSIFYMIGLSFSGIQYAMSIGLIAGICRIIPYLDIVVGLLLSGIAILSNGQGFGEIFFVLAVFGVVQALDGVLITPKVIGTRLGVHPVVVILTILAFANLWGFWGVLIAIPLVAMIKTSILNIIPVYKSSKLYKIKP